MHEEQSHGVLLELQGGGTSLRVTPPSFPPPHPRLFLYSEGSNVVGSHGAIFEACFEAFSSILLGTSVQDRTLQDMILQITCL